MIRETAQPITISEPVNAKEMFLEETLLVNSFDPGLSQGDCQQAVECVLSSEHESLLSDEEV